MFRSHSLLEHDLFGKPVLDLSGSCCRLDAKIIGIAGALETGDGFREFVEGGVKLGRAPGKLRLESIAPPRYRPLDGRSEECRGRDLLCQPGILRPDQIEHQWRFLAFRQHLAAALVRALHGPPLPPPARDLPELA